jgi:hypothetical protein
MKQPLTELDTRFSAQNAVATDWGETRRALEDAALGDGFGAEMSSWSRVNASTRRDVDPATVRATPSTNATRTVVRRRMDGAGCTTRSYDGPAREPATSA